MHTIIVLASELITPQNSITCFVREVMTMRSMINLNITMRVPIKIVVGYRGSYHQSRLTLTSSSAHSLPASLSSHSADVAVYICCSRTLLSSVTVVVVIHHLMMHSTSAVHSNLTSSLASKKWTGSHRFAGIS